MLVIFYMNEFLSVFYVFCICEDSINADVASVINILQSSEQIHKQHI